MQVIPVLDLKGGQVVHAQRGQRDRYPPLSSRLCAASSAEAVVRGFLSLFPFRRIYAADLDAIAGTEDHTASLFALARTFPDIAFWVDAGFRDLDSIRDYRALAPANIQAVLGSETLRAAENLAENLAEPLAPSGSVILSLDFRDGAYVGPPELADDPALWPEHVIAMTLARVGTGLGPDLDLLRRLRNKAPAARLYAAGGVRDGRDLETLAGLGIDGVLVASALHDGRITGADLDVHRGIPAPAGAHGDAPSSGG